MNIFIFDPSHVVNAQSHPDKLVVKMQLEAAQLIHTTISSKLGFSLIKQDGSEYRCTHQNHPCSVWLSESHSNLVFGIKYFESLVAECERRYKLSEAHFRNLQRLYEYFGSSQKLSSYLALYPCQDYAIAINDFWLQCFHKDGIIDTETFNRLLNKKRADLSTAVKLYRTYLLYAKCHYAEWRYTEPPVFWSNQNLSLYNGRFSKLNYKKYAV